MDKRMKMKLLDYTLLCLLAGATTPLATAAAKLDGGAPGGSTEPAEPIQGGAPEQAPAALDCGADACTGDDGLLFQLRTRSHAAPVTRGTHAGSSSDALQPDRRVEVSVEPQGRAVAMGKYSIDLPGGGVVWATEDPTLGAPELSVSAPSMVAFDGERVLKPVQFYGRVWFRLSRPRVDLSAAPPVRPASATWTHCARAGSMTGPRAPGSA